MTRVQPPGTIGIEPDYHSGDGGSRAMTPMDPPGPLGIDHTDLQTVLDRYDMVELFANRICDRYRHMSGDETQIVSIDIEGYEYLFDPALGRVVGILGYSWYQEDDRDSYYMSSFLGRNTTRKLRKQLETRGYSGTELGGLLENSAMSWTERYEILEGGEYDRGHFISLKQGGAYDINLFPQRRDVNQSGSELGSAWRGIEEYCVANPGTFCYVRPVYEDQTWVPSEIEYGYLRDGMIIKRIFPNRF